MGSESNDTETEKPTQTVQLQPNNQLHSNSDSPEDHVNGYEAVTNNKISYHDGGADSKTHGNVGFIPPHSLLPMPVPPETLKTIENDESQSSFSVAGSMPAFGSFIRQRSINLSAAIAKRVSSFRQSIEENETENNDRNHEVTEFNLLGLKVVVKMKSEEESTMKGRITFFSRSGCRDCTAVRKFFKEKELKFVEINVDVFREREKELRDRTGKPSVPQIFFNNKLIGGLVALNSLRNSGEFDRRLEEIVAENFAGDDAPLPPVYGYDYHEDDRTDEMVGIVSILRQKITIQDRLRRMKIVKNCFEGDELVEVVVQYLKCARNEVRFLYRICLLIYYGFPYCFYVFVTVCTCVEYVLIILLNYIN